MVVRFALAIDISQINEALLKNNAPSVNRVVLSMRPHGVATGCKVTRIQPKFAFCLLTSEVSQSSIHARVQTVPSPTVHILKDSKYVVQCHSRLCQSVCKNIVCKNIGFQNFTPNSSCRSRYKTHIKGII